MTQISKRARRGRGGAARLDLTPWKKLFADRRMWVVLARVELHEGETTHFEFVTDATGARVLYVDVVSIPSEIELSCRMPGEGGIWRIPAVGTEVYVGIPDGEIDFVPGILAVIGAPGASGGLAADTAVIELAPGMKLKVHDGDAGEAHDLPTMADFNALRAHVDKQFDAAHGHVHVVAGAATTTQVSATGPFTSPTTPAPTPDGTQTFEVK